MDYWILKQLFSISVTFPLAKVTKILHFKDNATV